MLVIVRGLVRPVVTIVTTISLVSILSFLVWKFGDRDMAKETLVAFLALVSLTTGFWFGSRNKKEGTNDSPTRD